MDSKDLSQYLQPSPTMESQHPQVLAFVEEHLQGERDPVRRAVKLFFAVRDKIRYDPYTINLTVDGLKASTTLAVGRAWCVPKAVLLGACCRAAGVPARLGFADVRNHLSTARMRALMKTDIFTWHGYTAIHLNGSWLKATPAFNIELCEKFRLRPLDFDGHSDALFHPFDLEGKQHMEYVNYRGEFDEVPIDDILANFKELYVDAFRIGRNADFDLDVAQEMSDQ